MTTNKSKVSDNTLQVVQAELHYNIQYKRRLIWKQVKETVKALGILQSSAKAQTVRLAPTSIFRYWLSFNMTKLVNEALQTNQTVVAVKVYFLIVCTIQVLFCDTAF